MSYYVPEPILPDGRTGKMDQPSNHKCYPNHQNGQGTVIQWHSQLWLHKACATNDADLLLLISFWLGKRLVPGTRVNRKGSTMRQLYLVFLTNTSFCVEIKRWRGAATLLVNFKYCGQLKVRPWVEVWEDCCCCCCCCWGGGGDGDDCESGKS